MAIVVSFLSLSSAFLVDWPRSMWRARNIKCICWSWAHGVFIYLVMGFSGNSTDRQEGWPVAWSTPSTRAPPLLILILSCLSSFGIGSAVSLEFFSATIFHSSRPFQAWKCSRNIIHHNFVCRVDLQAFELWEDRRENELIMRTVKLIDLTEIPGNCVCVCLNCNQDSVN